MPVPLDLRRHCHFGFLCRFFTPCPSPFSHSQNGLLPFEHATPFFVFIHNDSVLRWVLDLNELCCFSHVGLALFSCTLPHISTGSKPCCSLTAPGWIQRNKRCTERTPVKSWVFRINCSCVFGHRGVHAPYLHKIQQKLLERFFSRACRPRNFTRPPQYII